MPDIKNKKLTANKYYLSQTWNLINKTETYQQIVHHLAIKSQ